MRRTQIYLDEDVDNRLRTIARLRGCSAAALVREAVEDLLLREDEITGEDPLEGLIGAFEGEGDESLNHDHYLYGAPKRQPAPTSH